MKRWILSVMLVIAAMAALAVGASAAANPATVTTENGCVLTKIDGGWKLTGYTGNDPTVKIPGIYKYTPEGSDEPVEEPVLEIGKGVFTGKQLENLTIPGQVVKMENYAFADILTLKSVTFLDYVEDNGVIDAGRTTISASAFSGCFLLETVTLSGSIGEISANAFANCTSLKSIVFPVGITTIGNNAFNGCTNLNSLVFLGPATSLKSIGESTVFPWNYIKIVHCPSGFTQIQVTADASKLIKPEDPEDPEDAEKIEEYLKSIIHEVNLSAITPTVSAAPANKPCSETNTPGTVTTTFTCPISGCRTFKNGMYPTDGTSGTDGKFSQKRYISPLVAHTVGPMDDEPATCTKKGKTGGFYCRVCYDILVDQDETEALGHDWDLAPEHFPANIDPDDFSPSANNPGEYEFRDKYKAKKEEITRVDSTCDKQGYLTWTPICSRGGTELCSLNDGKDSEKTYYLPPHDIEKEGHTYDTNNFRPYPAGSIAATCDVQGVDVTRLFCDGGHMVQPCKAGTTADGVTATCEVLLAAIKEAESESDEAWEEAVKAYISHLETFHVEESETDEGDGGPDGGTSGSKDGSVRYTLIDKGHKWEFADGKGIEDYPVPYDCAMDHLTITHRVCSRCGEVEGPVVKGNEGEADKLYACDECKSFSDAVIAAAEAIPEFTLPDVAAEFPGLEAAYDLYNQAVADYVTHLEQKHKAEPDIPVKYTSVRDSQEHEGRPLPVPNEGATIDCEKGGEGTYPAYNCAKCGTYTGETPAHFGGGENHEFEFDWAEEPTGDCINGQTQVIHEKCKKCGAPNSYEEELIGKDTLHVKAKDENGNIISRVLSHRDVTCTVDGVTVTEYECENCHQKFPETTTVKAEGHKWGEFQPENGVMPEPADDCTEQTVYGTATCTECGADYIEEHTGEDNGDEPPKLSVTVPGKMSHNWKWTPDENGTTETEVCQNCQQRRNTRPLSGGGSGGGNDNNDNDNNNNDDGNTGATTPDPDTTYIVSVSYGSGGTASASPSSAKSGVTVTISVSPSSGYELDLIRVTTDTSVVSTSSLGGGRYSFTMPAANVKVGVTFSQLASSSNSNWTGSSGSSSSSSSSSTPSQAVAQSVPRASVSGQVFSDILASHWAAGEINWASQMGYMNGSNGRFNPDGNITHQQLWMILARLTGNNPSNMAEAQRWAVNGGFAVGSAPEGPISRHQLVTALYRCAHLMGTNNRSTTSLAGFPDSRTVPAGARDAFAWAISNGIIGGDANGRLNPNGTLTRAQFAVILYRFSQRV